VDNYDIVKFAGALLGLSGIILAAAWAGYFEPRVKKIVGSKISILEDEQNKKLEKSQETQIKLLMQTFYSKDDGIVVATKVDAMQKDMESVKKNIVNIFKKVDEQNQTLARIEGRLNK